MSPQHHCRIFLFLAITALASHFPQAQQIGDTAYLPEIKSPAYSPGSGPAVSIDEGHHNFHTRDGRYSAFARLLERDGYRVEKFEGSFEPEKLQKVDILVISNALHESNISEWYLPTPSAFTDTEIEFLTDWVSDGGSLFLIADHMPMAGAAEKLAAAFGFEFTNGFVFDTTRRGPAVFTNATGTLQENEITVGTKPHEQVDSIASFTGQAFRPPADAQTILRFEENYINLLPDTAWVFDSTTTALPAAGWSQGAFMEYGNGRIVVFGEAAMFTAQLAGPEQRKVGMNSPVARRNYQLLLNIIHWLDH